MSKPEIAFVAFVFGLVNLAMGFAAFWLVSLAFSVAHAHKAPSGWEYDQWCCSHLDCRQLADGDVNEVNGGWYIKSIDILVPYKHPEIRVSGDAHFHLCELPKGTVRCFYVPPGGV